MILAVKWLHIVSSTILFGAGIGSAFYVFMANRQKDIASIRFATRLVVTADWLFTTPAIIVQFATGLALMHLTGTEFTDLWIMAALLLFFFAGLCWLPVVWIQYRMRDLAEAAFKNSSELPRAYWRLERWWVILGALAFPTVLIIFYLMVTRPV